MLIRNTEVEGRIVDVLLKEARIFKIAPHIEGVDYIDANGATLIPGLHDHHIHLNASAAALNSIFCGPPEAFDEISLIKALHRKGEGWLRGIGYHQSVAGELDRCWLDKYGPQRPIRIQHRSGRLWILNSLAMEELAMPIPKDGRLFDNDKVLQHALKQTFPDLTPFIRKLLSWGITGITEVTPSNNHETYQHYQKNTAPLKFEMMGDMTLTADHSKYLKLHYHEYNLPSLDQLTEEIKIAHDKGRHIAAHCVTRAELMLILAALEAAGPTGQDRIEHAAIADDTAIEWMQKLDVIVVTQPNFIVEREVAYRKEVPEYDHENLWRLRSFKNLRAAIGSDAPFGNANPWMAMAAAINRPKGFGQEEAISPEEALTLYTKPASNAGALPRKITQGAVADLCLLDRTWKEAADDFSDVNVMATWIDGVLVYNRVNEAPV